MKTPSCEILFFGSFQVTAKEIAGGAIRGQPIPMQKKVVDFVRKDKLFDLDVPFAETRDKIDSLREEDIAIVVPMNEKDRRFPSVHGGDGRRIVRQFGEFGRYVFPVPIVRGPVVHAVKIDASGK